MCELIVGGFTNADGAFTMPVISIFGGSYAGHAAKSDFCTRMITSPVSIFTKKPLNYDGMDVTAILEVDYFKATHMLSAGDKCIWLSDSKEIARTRPPLFLKYGAREKPDRFLICEDCIYDGGFNKMIKFPGVISGQYWRGKYWAVSSKELRCITTGDNYPIETSRGVQFVDGFIVWGDSKNYKYTQLVEFTAAEPGACVVCRTRPEKFMTYGCGHSLVCEGCHLKGVPVCPVCKKKIDVAIVTYPR